MRLIQKRMYIPYKATCIILKGHFKFMFSSVQMNVALDASIYVLHINVFNKYYDVADVMLTFDYGPFSNISQ